jgi:hypothetical protein
MVESIDDPAVRVGDVADRRRLSAARADYRYNRRSRRAVIFLAERA